MNWCKILFQRREKQGYNIADYPFEIIHECIMQDS